MNATTRFLTQWDIFSRVEATSLKEAWGVILAAILVLMTALVLVYIKDLNRQLYSELESRRQNYEELKIQKDRLLLEENTWAAQARAREIAQERLDMVLPNESSIVTIKKAF